MDITQIRYFLEVVKTGGFTKAADSLFISQPSLSVSLKRLERELSVTLFERGGRRAVLTPAGHYFLESAQEIWDKYQGVLNGLRDFHNHPTLRIGILRTFRINEISRMIKLFRNQNQNAVIELRDGTSNDMRNWLEMGEVDLTLTELSPLDNADTSLSLFQQEYLLAVPKGHPFTQKDMVSLEDLDDKTFIGRNNCEIWGKAPQIFEAAGIEPQVVYLADREEWAISMLQAGLGITIMPVWANLPDIVYIPIAELNLSRTVGLKWRAKQNSEVVKLFREFAAHFSWHDSIGQNRL